MWGPTKVTDVFSDAREKASAETLKCSASELLGAYPLLRHFAATVIEPTGAMVAERRSLRRLCAMLDGFVAAKRVETPDMPRLVVFSGRA